MISALLGLLSAIAITVYACFSTSGNHAIYLDRMSVLIVVGGTLSAAFITFNFKQLRYLAWSLSRVFTREIYHAADIVKELVEIADQLNKNPATVNGLIDGVSHPFIKDGLRLVANDFDPVTIENIMVCSITERKNAHLAHVDIMRALAKYPPAFGMIGTVIGLVALLQNISADGGVAKIGPNMAVALITTLYGLLISNFIFIPMGENIYNKVKRDTQIRRIIMEGILLIRKKEDAMAIQEYLNSFLHPNNRTDILGTTNVSAKQGISKGKRAA
ncbi:MAG: MotA/TolQ/ExbB proton channel family protein [Bdellovibrio sp.]|nr:MotA/TolQ/ExbB proton channel family protein [Bdellovibrio sp.]